MLSVLENPVRRGIIRRLSQETSYPLELSSELGVHQQLVAKHLKVMEQAGIVEAKREASPHGPDRRMFGLTRGVSLTIDFSPDLYGAHMFPLGEPQVSHKLDEAGELRERLESISGKERGFEGVNPYAELIAEIDHRISQLDSERMVLLHLRCQAMRAAKESIMSTGVSFKERFVLYHVLNRNVRTARDIANGLDMRREVVARILDKLREESILR